VKRSKTRDREVLYLGRNPEFVRLIDEARARLAAGQKLSFDQMKKAILPKRSRKAKSKRSAARKRRPIAAR